MRTRTTGLAQRLCLATSFAAVALSAALALGLGACGSRVPVRSQGVSVRALHEPDRSTAALSPFDAPVASLARNDASLSPRASQSMLDRTAFATARGPDVSRPQRIYLSTQENTITFFRVEGVQFRDSSSRLWTP
jgi:hypothetical protein